MSAHTRAVPHGAPTEEIREQEVLRATKELAAYFKGQRTEREARAALKIIRAFVKDRERMDPARRRPLPGLAAPKAAAPARPAKKSASPRKARRSRPRRPMRETPVTSPAADSDVHEPNE